MPPERPPYILFGDMGEVPYHDIQEHEQTVNQVLNHMSESYIAGLTDMIARGDSVNPYNDLRSHSMEPSIANAVVQRLTNDHREQTNRQQEQQRLSVSEGHRRSYPEIIIENRWIYSPDGGESRSNHEYAYNMMTPEERITSNNREMQLQEQRRLREQEVCENREARRHLESATDDKKHRKPRTMTTLQVRSGWEVECTSTRYSSRPNCDNCAYDEDDRDCDFCRNEFSSEMPMSNEVEQHHDGSVNGRGLEFISSKPHTPLRTMRHLQEFMDTYKPRLDRSCGIHFHISIRPKVTDDMKPDLIRKIEKKYKNKINMFSNNLYMLAAIYEDKIFELLPRSRNGNNFCRKLSSVLNKCGDVKKKLGKLNEMKYGNSQRYCWLNFVELYRPNGIRTIEFRSLGDTENTKLMIAYFTLFIMMFWGALQIDIVNDPATLKRIMDELQKQLRRIERIKNGEQPMSSQDDLEIIQRTQNQIENMKI